MFVFDGLLAYLKTNLPYVIMQGGYNSYEIFGKEAESPISDAIEGYLRSRGVMYTAHRAKTKNDFPDLEIEIAGIKYALEHKAAVYDFKGELKSSAANDMGTINAYPEKIQKYGDRIYCTFVKYVVLPDNSIQIADVYFDKIYVFIGQGTGFDGQLRYREKDGNLRPKSWADMAAGKTYFSDLSSFQTALSETDAYRSQRIIRKKLETLGSDALQSIRDFIDSLLE